MREQRRRTDLADTDRARDAALDLACAAGLVGTRQTMLLVMQPDRAAGAS
ncbi:MAG TPA: hypothetical protein VFX59_06920 [Polyangiales bacterium]|nr:hypothetical protein [Polyangiales bacterium]